MRSAATHRKFIGSLIDSLPPVQLVAGWAALNGRRVEIEPMRFAPTEDAWREHADDGFDMVIAGRTVDVKQLIRTPFVTLKEFESRFPDQRYPVLLSSPGKALPDYFLTLNDECTHAMVVSSDTRPMWHIREMTDRRSGDPYQRYATTTKHAKMLVVAPSCTQCGNRFLYKSGESETICHVCQPW